MDDLEMRSRECAVRGSEGRSYLRSAADVHGRTRAHDQTLCLWVVRFYLSGEGRARAGYGYERADDGVDHGHILDARKTYSYGCRHGKANRPRRFIRTARSNRARHSLRGQ